MKQSDDDKIAGLAAKIDREETYHRMHAQMWHERLKDEPRYQTAIDELRPLLDERGRPVDELRPLLDERGRPGEELAELWEEMTMVRRSQPAGTKW